jgi:hypothetical protein
MPDSPLVVAPQMFGNARIAYDIGSGWPTVALAAHYQGANFFQCTANGPCGNICFQSE